MVIGGPRNGKVSATEPLGNDSTDRRGPGALTGLRLAPERQPAVQTTSKTPRSAKATPVAANGQAIQWAWGRRLVSGLAAQPGFQLADALVSLPELRFGAARRFLCGLDGRPSLRRQPESGRRARLPAVCAIIAQRLRRANLLNCEARQ